jgi:regulator of protease activity HflC (stomatin/prohibitin superfamily)
MVFIESLIALIILYVVAGLKIINQYEQALVFTLGKYSGIKQPGLRFRFLIIQRLVKVDM